MPSDTRARAIVHAFYDTWTQGDSAAAAAFLTEDFRNVTSINTYNTIPEYLESLRAFRRIVTDLEIISELYSETEATLIYRIHSPARIDQSLIVEHFRLAGEHIAEITTIFDA